MHLQLTRAADMPFLAPLESPYGRALRLPQSLDSPFGPAPSVWGQLLGSPHAVGSYAMDPAGHVAIGPGFGGALPPFYEAYGTGQSPRFIAGDVLAGDDEDEGFPEGFAFDDGLDDGDDLDLDDFAAEASRFAEEAAVLRRATTPANTAAAHEELPPVLPVAALVQALPAALVLAPAFVPAHLAQQRAGAADPAAGSAEAGPLRVRETVEDPAACDVGADGPQSSSPPLSASSSAVPPEERPICSFAAAGSCARGKDCQQLHGDEQEVHKEACQANQRKLEQLRRSQEVECGVCLERVLSKPRVAERKFGILSGCDHAFCVACIRGWRGATHATPGMDVDRVVRACPVCRVQSHFVTPSVVWYSNAEEKEAIITGYKAKLGGIDCRYFDFGNGNCPFSTSCFYRHAYRDGKLESVKLRHLGNSDGDTVIAKEVPPKVLWLGHNQPVVHGGSVTCFAPGGVRLAKQQPQLDMDRKRQAGAS
eukprot:SM000196S05358  [mRNA]  locus=s196:10279:14289:- [translate_table: standard]